MRSVPETLEKAAQESLEALSATSASEKDLMKAPILAQGFSRAGMISFCVSLHCVFT